MIWRYHYFWKHPYQMQFKTHKFVRGGKHKKEKKLMSGYSNKKTQAKTLGPRAGLILASVQEMREDFNFYKRYVSGQITIIPKPELSGFFGDSLTKPPFGVTSAEVVIICPDV